MRIRNIFVALAVALAGCSSGNDQAVVMTAAGIHPAAWKVSHKSANLDACRECHGAQYQGGKGPACTQCHVYLQAGKIPVIGECVSCHAAIPPTSGSHNAHFNVLAVNGVTGTDWCAACHEGHGYGSATHANGVVNVSIASSYKAKTGGPLSFSAGTCANVSCHGGQNTPPWASGSIDTNNNCVFCHASGTTQYNSYNSGRHEKHIGELGMVCTDCHSTTKLADNHFSNLNTANMEGPAWQTVGGAGTEISNYTVTRSCTPTSASKYFFGCHEARTW